MPVGGFGLQQRSGKASYPRYTPTDTNRGWHDEWFYIWNSTGREEAFPETDALSPSTPQQNPKALNPPQKRSGDMLSGIDRVNSKLANCIEVAEITLQDKEQKSGGGICGGVVRQTPGLFG